MTSTIHPTAKINSAVIGPYATIEANVTASTVIIRNSIIDPGATITNCVLDQALVGENARVGGQAKALFVGDNSTVEVG